MTSRIGPHPKMNASAPQALPAEKVEELSKVDAPIIVASPNVHYTPEEIVSDYTYETTRVTKAANGRLIAENLKAELTFHTQRRVPKTGVMLVGWGGNNGTTMTAGILANRLGLKWHTRTGEREANFYGSLTQCATVRLGVTADGDEVNVPIHDLLPMIKPTDLAIGGWDISGVDMGAALQRAKVLDYDLQRQLIPIMSEMKPLPSIYFPDFIAANQEDRADNVLPKTMSHKELIEHIRGDIRNFKKENGVEKVIVLWTATTERFAEVRPGLNQTADELLASIERNEKEIAPSTMFAVATILEKDCFINGSPQNTLVPGVIDLAQRNGVHVAGDDFKSGQTKIKSVLADFLIGAGLKIASIVSYNHLGNNDGKNLSSPAQFRSKEITKASVVDDVVEGNRILYKPGEKPDHCIVIKYVPYVGDSKRAMDEYTSEIFMGGVNTIAIHNTCEDSLLAAPLMTDLVVLTELMTRITYQTKDMEKPEGFATILSILSYLLKCPMVPSGTPVVNALARQRECIENILRACIGLAPQNNMLLEYKTKFFFPIA